MLWYVGVGLLLLLLTIFKRCGGERRKRLLKNHFLYKCFHNNLHVGNVGDAHRNPKSSF
jgi:hypothetical protein